MNCVLHKALALQYFCETCLDPICEECVKSNPHSNEFHRVVHIQQAINNRQQEFQNYVQNYINPLRQQVKQKLEHLKQNEDRELQKRNVIAKDIMFEFEAMDHRIQQKASKAVLEYQTQIKYHQAYLNNLDDLAYTFEKTCSDPYNFLILYQEFNEKLKNLELRQVTERIQEILQIFGKKTQSQVSEQPSEEQNHNIDQNINQQNYLRKLQTELKLPRQFKQAIVQTSQLESLRERNDLMNSLIALSCQNYRSERKKVVAESSAQYKNKLHIFNNINKNILKLKACKSCAFCGLVFTIDIANEPCGQNKSVKVTSHEHYAQVKIPIDLKGSKRHFWVDSSFQSRKVPDHSAHALLKINSKKQFLSSLNDLSQVRCCFRKYEIENTAVDHEKKTSSVKSFLEVFQTADKQKKGYLSKITFKYILTKIFEMNQLHGDVLTELLSYNWKSSHDQKIQDQPEGSKDYKKMPQKLEVTPEVNYRLLHDFEANPLFFFQQWVKIDEQNDKSKSIAPKSQDRAAFKYGRR